jgi:endo-1,4-beta-mannosidase
MLPDGVQTFQVIARDSQFTVSDLVDVLTANHPRPANFISTSRTTFVDGSVPFRYVGWNEYDLFTRTDETIAHDEMTSEGNILLKGTVISWQQQIDRQMMEAERSGLTVLRTWAFDNSATDPSAFQTGPGQYNEAEFAKLDYILASAQRHHIRVILTLENYWGDYGGIQQMTNWLGLANKLQFFTDPTAQAYYKQYVAHLVNRINTVTGVAYKNDPTIFAWELMNEPRMDCSDDPTPTHQYCDPSGQTLRAWISAMSGYVKSLDPRHMVTTGSEGHGFVSTGPNGQGIQWAGTQEGNNNDPLFVQNVPTIDFFTFHPYPNASWANLTLSQTNQIIQGITREGLSEGKPVVMEEYGIDRSLPVFDQAGAAVQPTDAAYQQTRVMWYQDMLDTLYRAGGAGSNVWQLADWSDAHYNINPYLPQADAARDVSLMRLLRREAFEVDPRLSIQGF